MASIKVSNLCLLVVLICIAALTASAQSFRVQCPTSTITHPAADNNSEPAYNGPTQFTPQSQTAPGWSVPTAGTVNGAIKCQQISGGDGYATMGDGTQTFMFSFGPLSGLADIAAGGAGTEPPNVFNTVVPQVLQRGDPAATDGATTGAAPGSALPESSAAFTWNGAVGVTPSVPDIVSITDILEGTPPVAPNNTPPPATLPVGADYCSTTPGTPGYPGPNVVTAYLNAPLGNVNQAFGVGSQVVIANDKQQFLFGGVPTAAGFLGTWTVTCINRDGKSPDGLNAVIITYDDPNSNLAANTGNFDAGTAGVLGGLDGHVDPRQIMDIGVMNGNIPAPLAQFDEDDEFFLTLTNVGMIMRPDLFEQHTVHFHGYPNASSFYDGVPDASVAINIGASFTYYYLAPDAGTYFWHCHITPPEHLQMGMVGQLHVRPRQNRVPAGGSLYTYLGYQNGIEGSTGLTPDLRTECNPAADILCSATMPFGGATANPAVRAAANTLCSGAAAAGLTPEYTYNDGDGSTCYDVEYPIQMHGFDPNFHFVGMTFNPEMFVDMKDKYFLLNGRSYPDTVQSGPQATVSTDGVMHYSQPMPAIINIPVGGKALLRLVNLSVTEYHTLQSLGVPMKVVGWNAKLLRDQAGINTEYYTNSITLGGGESLDAILDASNATLFPAGTTFYLYTPQLDHLSNDAENFGGMMTEVHICNTVTGGNTYGNTCN
ncbi:MAG TPA: multicopper oxidase domain-containing protein [Terriglobales bacterium]|nr:multicopper oxidase domain-containing protein [Terriglobales bacterium]